MGQHNHTLPGWLAAIRDRRKREDNKAEDHDSGSDPGDKDTDGEGWLTEEDEDRWVSACVPVDVHEVAYLRDFRTAAWCGSLFGSLVCKGFQKLTHMVFFTPLWNMRGTTWNMASLKCKSGCPPHPAPCLPREPRVASNRSAKCSSILGRQFGSG